MANHIRPAEVKASFVRCDICVSSAEGAGNALGCFHTHSDWKICADSGFPPPLLAIMSRNPPRGAMCHFAHLFESSVSDILMNV